jgi:toxin CcdB
MAQFDVYRNPKRGAFPLLLDVQDDLLAQLGTRVVVPLSSLRTHGAVPISRLNPTTRVGSTTYVLVFQELAAIPVAALGAKVASLADRRTDLVAALDLLFTGI